jgi:hypothetical protein
MPADKYESDSKILFDIRELLRTILTLLQEKETRRRLRNLGANRQRG